MAEEVVVNELLKNASSEKSCEFSDQIEQIRLMVKIKVENGLKGCGKRTILKYRGTEEYEFRDQHP